MKYVLVAIVLLGIFYFALNNEFAFFAEREEPYYIELRVDMESADVQLVGIGKMVSYQDCRERAFVVWMNNLEHLGKVSLSSECKKELPEKYLQLFENKQATASYVAFDKGTDDERDARFLIYGVPSSYVFRECENITRKVAKEYSGKVYCIKGSVG